MSDLKIPRPGGEFSAGQDQIEGRAHVATHEFVVAEGEGEDSLEATIETWFPGRAAARRVETDLHAGNEIGVADRSGQALAQDIGVVRGFDPHDPAIAQLDPDIPEMSPAVEGVVGDE